MNQSFFKCVEDRKKDILLQMIKDNKFPGTTIISDCWKAYGCLESEGYRHLTVNHSEHFVDPDSGACTNTIESMWRALKKSLPVSGTVNGLYNSYFCQYCIRKKYLNDSDDQLVTLLQLISRCLHVTEEEKKLTSDILVQSERPKSDKPPKQLGTILHDIIAV